MFSTNYLVNFKSISTDGVCPAQKKEKTNMAFFQTPLGPHNPRTARKRLYLKAFPQNQNHEGIWILLPNELPDSTFERSRVDINAWDGKLWNIQTIALFAPFFVFMRLHLVKFSFKLSHNIFMPIGKTWNRYRDKSSNKNNAWTYGLIIQVKL